MLSYDIIKRQSSAEEDETKVARIIEGLRVASLVFAIAFALIALPTPALVFIKRRKIAPVFLFIAAACHSIVYGIGFIDTGREDTNFATLIAADALLILAGLFLPLAYYAGLDHKPKWFPILPLVSFLLNIASVVLSYVGVSSLAAIYGLAIAYQVVVVIVMATLGVIAFQQPRPPNKWAKWLYTVLSPVLVLASIIVLGVTVHFYTKFFDLIFNVVKTAHLSQARFLAYALANILASSVLVIFIATEGPAKPIEVGAKEEFGA